MALSIVPYVQVLLFATQYVYPLIQSFRTLERVSEVESVQWVVYWIICVLYQTLEPVVLFLLVDYFPLFQEIKLLVFLWLVVPETMGAAWLWYACLQRLHQGLDEKYYQQFVDGFSKIGPNKAAAGPVAHADEEDEE
eukprot:gnl/MRDRNA2_/MRDRNA2_140007_c0_seq1.p1 gnl/MRDRNA2_/MRDRNA2_140007_c0~~gnl/MRDRNA2_/MRDRNA2_140007_c0_seq1.p1  ORF type:complete len:137 (+),score=17.51 gnl/MRDRNA2_/MRDRNA2_140007_c0_seq1:77-487(+)